MSGLGGIGKDFMNEGPFEMSLKVSGGWPVGGGASFQLASDQKQTTEEEIEARTSCWILTLVFAISPLYVTVDKQITLIYLFPSQGYGFSSCHVLMWELDYEESWLQKNWCFWMVVLEKTLEIPLDCKEIQPVHPEGDQSWVFIGRTDVEAETPILWPPHAKSWLIGKDPDAGKDWGQEEKGTTEDEMVGWHHRHNGHGFRWTPGVGDGQGGLACCGSWGRKESDTTERLNWTDLLPEMKMLDSWL